jgi:hypothetical protein
MELGLGIHGEPGVKRTHLQTADELTETLLTEILKHGKFDNEKRVAVMVNNLGATTEMELAIVARHAMPFLESEGFTVERIYAGTFLSSLDMAGISISVLGVNDARLRWLDAVTTAPAWPNVLKQSPGRPEAQIAPKESSKASSPTGNGAQSEAGRNTKLAIEGACRALIDAEAELTEMDRVTGDGDLGTALAARSMLVPRSPSPVTRSISVSSPSASISARHAASMASFIFLLASECAPSDGELALALSFAAICASGLPGRDFNTLGHEGAVVVASSQRSRSSLTPRTEIEIPAISKDERNVPA